MEVIKRSGKLVSYDRKKIYEAMRNSNKDVSTEDQIPDSALETMTENIESKIKSSHHTMTVEEIQDIVENEILSNGYTKAGKEYVKYRYKRELVRKSNTTDKQILSLIDLDNQEIEEENSNKNPVIVSVQRDYMAGEVSKDLSQRLFIKDQEVLDCHNKGIIHFHDMDYFAQHMYNCCLINIEDMLQNGTVISETKIEQPQSFVTACTITTQIIAQVASCQYGGQSITLAHLAPFVQKDRDKFYKKHSERLADLGIYNPEIIEKFVEEDVRREIEKGIQTMNYQVTTLQTTNGQAPFVTFFMYLNDAKNEQEKKDLAMIIEEVIKQRYRGMKNEKGVYVTPAFPKLIYVLQEDNYKEGTPYWYITKESIKCSIKRLVPDYMSEKKFKEVKEGNCFAPMGCRSMLSPYKDENGNYKFYGRFNQGVVTINLAYMGLLAQNDEDKFWKEFDHYLEVCHRALKIRHERLEGTTSDVAPILWQYGAIARLKPGEVIDPLLHGGYSTISLGYAGLYECTKAVKGCSHTDKENGGYDFAKRVMQHMNDKLAEWKKAENLGYALYGTPLESTTYKFAKANQNEFGIIEGLTEKNYVTNSYHVHVTEEIDAFTKFAFESEFQDMSLGGAISYVELPNMSDNLNAVYPLIEFIYNNVMYGELNVKSDYCIECGYDGEMEINEDEETGRLDWCCPNCGNMDHRKMSVARRTCGYIGSQFWNQGRTQEIRDRVVHMGYM